MKKTDKLLGIILITAVIGVFATCKDDEPEPQDTAKDQGPVTITGLFDNNASATVKGLSLTDAEWSGADTKIKNALNAKFGPAVDGLKDLFKRHFSKSGGITIIIEKSEAYTKYKTTANGNVIYINFNILNNADALGAALQDATAAMDGNPLYKLQAKVNDNCYQKMNNCT